MKLVLPRTDAHRLLRFFEKIGIVDIWIHVKDGGPHPIASIHPDFHDMFGGRSTNDFLMAYTSFGESMVTLKFFKKK